MLVYATQRPAVDIFERFVEKTFKVIANQHLKIHWTTLVAMPPPLLSHVYWHCGNADRRILHQEGVPKEISCDLQCLHRRFNRPIYKIWSEEMKCFAGNKSPKSPKDFGNGNTSSYFVPRLWTCNNFLMPQKVIGVNPTITSNANLNLENSNSNSVVGRWTRIGCRGLVLKSNQSYQMTGSETFWKYFQIIWSSFIKSIVSSSKHNSMAVSDGTTRSVANQDEVRIHHINLNNYDFPEWYYKHQIHSISTTFFDFEYHLTWLDGRHCSTNLHPKTEREREILSIPSKENCVWYPLPRNRSGEYQWKVDGRMGWFRKWSGRLGERYSRQDPRPMQKGTGYSEI